ncbi:hypothetical protein K431DRAFT_91387 [Polychaeton citri CBS 116435]|uniref:Uncharacterized protein n=1 Tax=Polychaeton citri CBS 116435 TaxID=1314669 RepID=A0A9P4Q4I9_9PEZI|nr:hypothetical protein K431DRAFT_91387 [Polychaeton citri CBS 116435]
MLTEECCHHGRDHVVRYLGTVGNGTRYPLPTTHYRACVQQPQECRCVGVQVCTDVRICVCACMRVCVYACMRVWAWVLVQGASGRAAGRTAAAPPRPHLVPAYHPRGDKDHGGGAG